MSRFFTALAGLIALGLAGVATGQITLSGRTYSITFDAKTGAISEFREAGKTGTIFRSGEAGLWQLKFADGTMLDASAFGATGDRVFSASTAPDGRSTRLTYRSPEAEVIVTATAGDQALDLVAQVTPKKELALQLALPARLRLDPDKLLKLVSPANGNESVGFAFLPSFFKAQPEDNPSSWQPKGTGSKGYQILYGGSLKMNKSIETPVLLRVTEEGQNWFAKPLAARLPQERAKVNRPPAAKQADLVLVDSDSGAYFSASHLGGQGYLWRIGGAVHQEEEKFVPRMVGAVVSRLAAQAPAGRNKVALIALRHGPTSGSWADVTIETWRETLLRAAMAGRGKVEFIELSSPAAMLEAAGRQDCLVILNPYGEQIPARPGDTIENIVGAIGKYVRGGGNWFETGGYPFHAMLLPARYYEYQTKYPAAFADFFHFESAAGAAAMYRVQPRPWAPWNAASDPSAMLVPGGIGCGGDEKGGYCDRYFGIFVEKGKTWTAPAVRLVAAIAAPDALRQYAQANGITRRLEDKMSAGVLEKFKNSVLVFYPGSAKEKIANLDKLPVPTQVHFADYLHGGFDKQYPDHLPPIEQFGTPQEFKEFLARGQKLGHLMMPYTNPTWWCDDPKGPTFEKNGDAPLLKKLDGKPIREQYSKNIGWTITYWHPAVRQANRETIRQFTQDYPVDLLFQDQCGARSWQYDINPASPTPLAYVEGQLSMIDEDSRTRPLSTESGWDRVVNAESQLCGMSWRIVPTSGGPTWRKMFNTTYDPAVWEIYPVAQYIAHDKLAMIHHDLGQFVTNRKTLAYTLGIGYSLSYRIDAAKLADDAPRHWLLWLDRVQKSICAPYIGQPITAFSHQRQPKAEEADDGIIQATYGPIQVVANVGPKARQIDNLALPAWGFVARSEDRIAANVQTLGGIDFGPEGISFVTQRQNRGADVWIYDWAGREVAVLLPQGAAEKGRVIFDGSAASQAVIKDGVLRLRLPDAPEKKRQLPPADLAGKAPRSWLGAKPAIAVLDLGFAPGSTPIKPSQWIGTLENSRLGREFKAPVRRITSPEELVQALKAGPLQTLAIINPYGERFPATGPGQWTQMLDLIRGYVEAGGCWWETAGYSFHIAAYKQEGAWKYEPVAAAGMLRLNLPIGNGEVDQPVEKVSAPAEAAAWLGDALAAQLANKSGQVNRGLPRGSSDPGHLTLLAGKFDDYIGGYRLNGWGWLWRIGGFSPDPQVALPVVTASLEYLYAHPPQPIKPGGTRYLFHATVTSAQ